MLIVVSDFSVGSFSCVIFFKCLVEYFVIFCPNILLLVDDVVWYSFANNVLCNESAVVMFKHSFVNAKCYADFVGRRV